MNNERRLASARRGNTVANELHETNPKIILMAETISRSLAAIVLNAVNVASSIFSFRKISLIKFILRKRFWSPFNFVL